MKIGKIMPADIKDDIERASTDDLIPYPSNPKEHPDKQIDKIAGSIQEYGFVQPLVVDEENQVIIGHGRLKAAKKLDLDEVPVIKSGDLSDAQKRALRIADNRIAESGWDEELLSTELDVLEDQDYDLDVLGFEEEELAELHDEQIEFEEDDFDEDADEVETDIDRGDIFQLGGHRLMCGDATDEEDVDRLMDGEQADMVFTDPPYGINIVDGDSLGRYSETGLVGVEGEVKANKYKKIEGDDKPFNPKHLLDYDSKLLLFGGNYYSSKLPSSTHWIVWDKKGEKGADQNNFSDAEIIWTNIDRKSTPIYRCLWSGMIKEGESGKRLHPTQKPIKLLSDILNDYSEKHEIIMDLYGGSGSTLIACEQLDRRCYMLEIDPQYCQVIIDRWEEFTGQNAEEI